MIAAGLPCVICGAIAKQVFTATVLARHDAAYFSCPACDYLWTPAPAWLAEAYTDAISRADTGLVARNLDLSQKVSCVLHALFDREGRYLDTAGGTGLFTRLMRDVGFDFWWEDPFCSNAMAPGFEARPQDRFQAVTAFEVLEHLTDPLGFVRSAIERSTSGTLIFTTELFSGGPPPRDWWYYAFGTGQHVSFYSQRTLQEIARLVGVGLRTSGGLHMFTRKDVSPWRYRWVLRSAERRGFRRVRRSMQSLTQADHQRMLEQAVAKS